MNNSQRCVILGMFEPNLFTLHSMRFTLSRTHIDILYKPLNWISWNTRIPYTGATIRILWFKQTNETTTDFLDIGKQRTVHSLHRATELQTSLFLFFMRFFFLYVQELQRKRKKIAMMRNFRAENVESGVKTWTILAYT